MSFVVRHSDRDYLVSAECFEVGRSLESDLPLDDPLVSRQHARLEDKGDYLLVTDLGSRNGVRVNGKRIDGSERAEHGDTLRVGDQTLVVIFRDSGGRDTESEAPRTQRQGALDVVFSLADKALGLGQASQAERLLLAHLEGVKTGVASGQSAPDESLDRAALFAVRLAGATGKARWLDYVFELYQLRGSVCSAEVVDALYEAVRHVTRPSVTPLRTYLGQLHNTAKLGPADRFLVRRLEGLEKLAR